MSSLKDRLVRLFYPYGAVRTVLRGPIKRTRFVVEPGMGFTYAMGVDSANLHFWKKCLHPEMTVYDIGANRGQMALYFAQMVGMSGTVVSCEPVPSIYETLTKNIDLNGLTNVKSICTAIDASNGVSTFEYSDEYSTQGKLRSQEPLYKIPGAKEQEVRTMTLDFVVADGYPPPDVIKVDVEGGADGVFRGAGDVLARYAPKVYIELHGPEEQAAVRDELMSKGYTVEDLSGKRIDDPTIGWNAPLWCYR